jgi:hypothetical protein
MSIARYDGKADKQSMIAMRSVLNLNVDMKKIAHTPGYEPQRRDSTQKTKSWSHFQIYR